MVVYKELDPDRARVLEAVAGRVGAAVETEWVQDKSLLSRCSFLIFKW
ncbi:hypothetical protein C8P63_10381 [Melghirimyces profundicolus]|uniref:Uncharacterized protein n=1 Tax=Melghirimyces profundicolus TaxID=1242148 RepID=A0A2T6C7K2_9BACL|nr:hypothetical protein C8P63_10381 [Melghirimyces profundicolus]